jgi:hypothetical protein
MVALWTRVQPWSERYALGVLITLWVGTFGYFIALVFLPAGHEPRYHFEAPQLAGVAVSTSTCSSTASSTGSLHPKSRADQVGGSAAADDAAAAAAAAALHGRLTTPLRPRMPTLTTPLGSAHARRDGHAHAVDAPGMHHVTLRGHEVRVLHNSDGFNQPSHGGGGGGDAEHAVHLAWIKPEVRVLQTFDRIVRVDGERCPPLPAEAEQALDACAKARAKAGYRVEYPLGDHAPTEMLGQLRTSGCKRGPSMAQLREMPLTATSADRPSAVGCLWRYPQDVQLQHDVAQHLADVLASREASTDDPPLDDLRDALPFLVNALELHTEARHATRTMLRRIDASWM